jgi:hypothetical protein
MRRANSRSSQGGVRSALGVLGIATSAASFVALTRNALNAGTELGKMATRLGITTDRLQELQAVARETGANVGDLEQGLQSFNRLLSEAANDSASAREVFARLGMSWRESSGAVRDSSSALAEFADKLRVKPQAEQAELAFKAFGRGASDMRLILSLTSAEMAVIAKQARALGLVLDPDNHRVV